MYNPPNEEQKYLKEFYITLKSNLQREKSLESNSVLLSFLGTISATRFILLKNSTIPSNLIPNNVLLILIDKKLIQHTEGAGSYTITAKGVWEYEKNMDILNEDQLLTFIDKKFFIGETSKKTSKNRLSEDETVILFAMIAARAFSINSAVNLRKDDITKDKWQEVLERSYDRLVNLNRVKKIKKDGFFKTKGNEHIVSHIFRHANDCIQKTKGIYSYTGNYEYYLDLVKDEQFSQESLSYLFWLIFEGKVSSEFADQIIDFCKVISSRESIYLFDMSKHQFSMPKYDSIIRDCLLNSVLSAEKWEKSV